MSLREAFLGIILAGLLAVTACGGGGGQSITIKASDYKFDPANVTVKVNQAVKITIQNTGTVIHDWAPQDTPEKVLIVVDPGKSKTMEVTFTKGGTYRVICTQPGHVELGMVGQLTVQ